MGKTLDTLRWIKDLKSASPVTRELTINFLDLLTEKPLLQILKAINQGVTIQTEEVIVGDINLEEITIELKRVLGWFFNRSQIEVALVDGKAELKLKQDKFYNLITILQHLDDN